MTRVTTLIMEVTVEEWSSMTAQQLMNKKDSIEEEIKSLHDELENVKIVIIAVCTSRPTRNGRINLTRKERAIEY